MPNINMLNGRTVASIVDEFFGEGECPAVVYCEVGKGRGFGELGQVVDYVPDTMGHLIMRDIPEGEDRMSNDGFETSVQSDWQHESNGYRWRVRF